MKLAKVPDVLVSHEMGHALGLQHTVALGDLMTQYSASSSCLPGLTDREVDALKGASALLEARESWETLFELRDRIVLRLKARSF